MPLLERIAGRLFGSKTIDFGVMTGQSVQVLGRVGQKTAPKLFVSARTHGSLDLWICGSVDLWICGSVDLWICGSLDLWICGSVDL